MEVLRVGSVFVVHPCSLYLKVPSSTILFASVTRMGISSRHAGRRQVLCPRDERVLIPNVRINPKTDLLEMLTGADRFLYPH